MSDGPLAGCQGDRAGRHRTRPHGRHAARRHGRLGASCRPQGASQPRRAEAAQIRSPAAQPPFGAGRSQGSGDDRLRARSGRRVGCADRGLSPRRDRAAGSGARGVPGAQSGARLWPHHRLGPGWPHGAGCGPRPQLHRADRCAARDRQEGTAAHAADQPGRRFRWRHDVPGDGRARGADRGAGIGQGPGRRCRDGGWRGQPDDAAAWQPGGRRHEHRARHQSHGFGGAVLRRLRVR